MTASRHRGRPTTAARPRGRGHAPLPHAYGALGLGKLANALKEPRASHIYFVVRDDAQPTPTCCFRRRTPTWQAYNRAGITSTYGSFDPADPMERAYKVSMNRPYVTRDYRAVNLVFNAEYSDGALARSRTATTSPTRPASTTTGAAP